MTTALITLEALHSALALPDFRPGAARALAAQLRMSPQPRGPHPDTRDNPPRQAGVLVLVYPQDSALHITLTRRTDTLRGHTGQISFPGGRRDPQDATFVQTALRETCEELGVCGADLTVIGELTPVYIPPSHYDVHPVVACTPEKPQFTPNPHEVAEVFSLTLDALVDPRTKQAETRELFGYTVHVPYYLVQGHKVWGATAVMLSELEARLLAALPPNTRTTQQMLTQP